MLDDFGLLSASLWHIERFTQQTQIRVDFEHSALEERFPAKVETALYRILQEGLTNVARHAQAKEVRVSLRTDAEHFTLEVEDDGRGIQAAALHDSKSLGLLGMKERALALQGDLAVTPNQPRGTRVTLRLPRVVSQSAIVADI